MNRPAHLQLPAELIRTYINHNIDYTLDEENLEGFAPVL